MDSAKESKAWGIFHRSLKQSSDGIVTLLVQACAELIEDSQESTMQGLTTMLDSNVEYLLNKIEADDSILGGRSNMSLQVQFHENDKNSLKSAYKIFKSHLMKSLTGHKHDSFAEVKEHLQDKAREFEEQTKQCKKIIKDLALDFIKNGITIFVYGFSRLVLYILQSAAEKNIRFSIITSECRPKFEGYDVFLELSKKIPVKVIVDSAIAYALEMCDIVLVGAEAVVENGGILNRVGTYTTALCAKTMKKPFYVMSESFKFTRMFPLSQKDLPDHCISKHHFELPDKKKALLEEAGVLDKLVTLHPLSDYTPPELITLIFTDLGIFTPSAVSDELIQIFDV